MNYYNEIKNKIIDNEIYEKVKDYSKERNRTATYFEIGKLLYEAGNRYGDNVIGKYAEKLTREIGKKYCYRTLMNIRKYYVVFSDEKLNALRSQLSWTHYRELIILKDINQIKYYLNITKEQNLSYRQLHEKIKEKEYERLDDKTKEKLISKEKIIVSDLIKNPILIKNSCNYNVISEKILKKLILEDIDSFLTELGSGFSYIKNEFKIRIGDRYNYIDFLLYNIKYHCYVVVELKITELKAEHIGQIQKYMNYIDKNIKSIDEGKTIGIIICKKENKFVIKYCSDERIVASEYEIV